MNRKELMLNKPARKGLCALILTLGILLGTTRVYAQAPAPTFVVATIKPAPPDARGQGIGIPSPGRLGVTNMTLQTMIGFAFGTGGLNGPPVTGGPSWIDKDRYVVDAIAEKPGTMADYRLMLKALLVERFGLKIHTTSKEINVFDLVLARSDGKLGPGVTPWDGTCPGGREPQPAAPRSPRCGAFFTPTGMNLTGDSMAVLADMLSAPLVNLGRPVVDKTGLTGDYNMMLEYKFTPPPPPGGPAAPGPSAASAPDDLLPASLGTALQEQFGLKLQPAKGMTDVLIVDQAEKPKGN
jgi:uncharacterized protein (TIGR03435 family)